MRWTNAICAVVVVSASLLFACDTDDSLPTGPSGVGESGEVLSGASVPDGGGATLKGCKVLDITARRVIKTTSGGSVTLLVTVDYDGDGEPYVEILDRETGRRYGRHAPGGITIKGLAPGSYDWQIFVEVNESRGFFQCDGGLTFEIPKPPKPPKPPKCDPKTQDCNPHPQCDVEALKYRAKRAAKAACNHGVKRIYLNEEKCTFRFTCKPPPDDDSSDDDSSSDDSSSDDSSS